MIQIQHLKIDDKLVHPVSVRTYEELLIIELLVEHVDQVFPYKPETPRYKVSADEVPMGYYKVLSARPQANNTTSILSLHRQ